jgi:thioredoxin 2
MTHEIFQCPECGSKNRIPVDKIGHSAKCGKCGSKIDTDGLKQPPPKDDTGPAYKVRCLSCKAKNRIPPEKMGKTAKCGRCDASIETSGLMTGRSMMVLDRDFDPMVLRSPLPVLLLFWANWCPSCQAVIPVVEQLASQWKGRVRVAKLNVDQNQIVAGQFNIMSVPTIMIFDNGQVKERLTGAVPKLQIVEIVKPYL